MRQRRAIPDQTRHRGEPLRGPGGGIDSDQFVPNPRGSTFPWSVAALERRHGIDFADYFATSLERLAPLVEDGLARIEPGRIVVTSRGRLLLRNIAMCFDRYLDQSAAIATPRFSRAI